MYALKFELGTAKVLPKNDHSAKLDQNLKSQGTTLQDLPGL